MSKAFGLKSSWPVVGASLLAAGLSYIAIRQAQNSKTAKPSSGGSGGASAAAGGIPAVIPAPQKALLHPGTEFETDESTLSNYRAVRVLSFHLVLSADFEKKVLSGSIDLELRSLTGAGVKTVVLDTKALNVKRVELVPAGTECKFSLAAPHEVLGTALEIQLPIEQSEFKLRITYETSPAASAIQWLPPSQTAGKKHPYLFTQCQAIHARSFFPCQDTPAVKSTYSAQITVPKELTALMSALSTGSTSAAGGNGSTTFTFSQKVNMPSYLVALAIGHLERRDISHRCAVWSEPETVGAGHHEFAETEKFLVAAEEICGPYVWGRYDVLLLPPSFPYGGMENPMLTFVTPTLLAGDRSLATVVAHEIAHSWMGNLVTNANWQHFWMNEGFTVWVERQILQKLYNSQVRDLHAAIGWKGLSDDCARFMSAEDRETQEFTWMVPKIKKGTDPDDVFSSVPYERGFNLLYYLEHEIVRDEARFGSFIKQHVARHAYGHVQTDLWIGEFEAWARDPAGGAVDEKTLASIDWKAWATKTGLPPVVNKYDPTLIDQARALGEKWSKGETGDVKIVKAWPSAQLQVALERLEDLQSQEFTKAADKAAAKAAYVSRVVAVIDAGYGFSKAQNCELRHRWLTIAVRADHEQSFGEAVKLLVGQGRMKYTRTLYRDLFKSKGSALAVSTFQANQSIYHSICAKMVARDLGLAK